MNRVTHVQSNDTINITTYEDQHSFTHCPSVGSIMSSYFPLNEDLQSIKCCLYFYEFFCVRDFFILFRVEFSTSNSIAQFLTSIILDVNHKKRQEHPFSMIFSV